MDGNDDNKQLSLADVTSQAEQAFGLPTGLLRSLGDAESYGLNQYGPDGNLIKSPTGATGAFQFTQGTAKQYGINRDNPIENVLGAAKYMRDNYKALSPYIHDNHELWLAAAIAHNRGLGAVKGMIKDGKFNPSGSDSGNGGDTLSYATKIANSWANYRDKTGNSASQGTQDSTGGQPISPTAPTPMQPDFGSPQDVEVFNQRFGQPPRLGQMLQPIAGQQLQQTLGGLANEILSQGPQPPADQQPQPPAAQPATASQPANPVAQSPNVQQQPNAPFSYNGGVMQEIKAPPGGEAVVRDGEESVSPADEAAQIATNTPVQFPHTFAKNPEDISDNSVIGIGPNNPRLTPEENLRQNAKAVLNHYAPVSDEQIDQWIQKSKTAGTPVTVGDESSPQMAIRANMLAQIIGPDNTRKALMGQLRTDTAQNRIENPEGPLPAVVNQEQADQLGPGPLSPEDIRNKLDASSGSDLLDTLNIPGKFLGRNLLAGVVGGGGHTANWLSGVLNTIEDLNPQRGDSMREATDPYGFEETNAALKDKGQPELSREQFLALKGLPPETKSFLRQGGDFFTGVGRAAENFQSTVGDKSLLGKGVQLLGNLTSDLPRMMLLPGGGVVNFAIDSGAQTRGQGGSTKDVLKATAQGGALGGLGEFVAPFVASAADTGAATLLNKSASPVFQKGVELATVGTGVYATSRLFGDSPEASFDNAVLMSAMHLSSLLGKKAEGKGIEVRDPNGNAIRVEIQDGKVQTTDKPTEIKVAVPESAETKNEPQSQSSETQPVSQEPAPVAPNENIPASEALPSEHTLNPEELNQGFSALRQRVTPEVPQAPEAQVNKPQVEAPPAPAAEAAAAPETAETYEKTGADLGDLYHGSKSDIQGDLKAAKSSGGIATSNFGNINAFGTVFHGVFLAKDPKYASMYAGGDEAKVGSYRVAPDAKVLSLPDIVSEEVLSSKGLARSDWSSLPKPTKPFPFQTDFDNWAFDRLNQQRVKNNREPFTREQFDQRMAGEFDPSHKEFDAEGIASQYLPEYIKAKGYDAVEMGREVAVLNPDKIIKSSTSSTLPDGEVNPKRKIAESTANRYLSQKDTSGPTYSHDTVAQRKLIETIRSRDGLKNNWYELTTDQRRAALSQVPVDASLSDIQGAFDRVKGIKAEPTSEGGTRSITKGDVSMVAFDDTAPDSNNADIQSRIAQGRDAVNEIRSVRSEPMATLLGKQDARAEGGFLRGNAYTNQLLNRVLDLSLGEENRNYFGLRLKPKQVDAVLGAIDRLYNSRLKMGDGKGAQSLANFRIALEKAREDQGGVKFFTDLPKQPMVEKFGMQEESLHQGNESVGIGGILNEEHANIPVIRKALDNLAPSYKETSLPNQFDEIHAKAYRDDAGRELGLSDPELTELRNHFENVLVDHGVTFDDVKAAFEGLSHASDERVQRYEQRTQDTTAVDEQNGRQDETQVSPETGSLSAARPDGDPNSGQDVAANVSGRGDVNEPGALHRQGETGNSGADAIARASSDKSLPKIENLYNKDGSIDHEQTKDVASRVISGELKIERLDPAGERGRIAGGPRNVEASLILAAGERADQESHRLGTREEQQNRQEQRLEKYARSEGIFYDYNHIDRIGQLVGGGIEARVYHRGSDPDVYKLIGYRHANNNATPLDFVDNRISLFNHLFPETPYELIGLTRDNNGWLRFIVKQPFVYGENASKADIIARMQAAGFERTGPESYSNDLYQVHDLHGQNVIYDGNGNTLVIDAIPKMQEAALRPYNIADKDVSANAAEALDPETRNLLDKIATHLYASGHTDLESFSKAMVDGAGEGVKPYLEDAYKDAQAKLNAEAPPSQPPAEPPANESGDTPEKIVLTGLKKSIDDAERQLMNMPDAPNVDPHSWEQAKDEAANTILKNPNAGRDIVKVLTEKPRALSDTESAILLHHKRTIDNDYNATIDLINKGHDSGDERAVAEGTARLGAISDDRLALMDAGRRMGTEKGRALNFQKALMKEDFSLASLEAQKRAANGGRPITEDERAKLQKTADDYKAKYEELQKHLNDRDLENSGLKDKLPNKRIIEVAENLVKKLDRRADMARERLKKRGAIFTAGLDPVALKDLAEIGASHIANVGLDFAKWSDKMVGEFGEKIKPHLQKIFDASNKMLEGVEPNVRDRIVNPKTPEEIGAKIKQRIDKGDTDVSGLIQRLAKSFVQQGVNDRTTLIDKVHNVVKDVIPDRRDVMDAISGYGKFRQLSKDAIDLTLRDLKGQMQQVAKLEDMAQGQAPAKTGFEHRAPSDEERHLIQQVEEAKRKGGFDVTDPETQLKTALAAAKTRMKNSIADLEKQIATREKIVKTKTDLQYDTEYDTLKTRRDELKKQFDEIFDKPGMSDEARLKAWKTRTQSRIDELKKKILTRDFAKKAPQSPMPFDAEGLKLKANVELIKKQFQADLEADRKANATKFEKGMNLAHGYVRFAVLSWPTTLGKLTSAALSRMALNPVEEGVKYGLKAGINKIAGIAGVTGLDKVSTSSFAIETKAIAAAATEGFKDSLKMLSNKDTTLDIVYGKGRYDKGVLEYPGQMHGAFKAPVKRAAFTRSMEKQIAQARRDGVDTRDPVIQNTFAVKAYQDANRDLFLQDNRIAHAYNGILEALQRRNAQGEVPKLGKAAATGLQVVFPIVRIPLNFISETATYAGGSASGLIKLGLAFHKGLENVSPEEQEVIVRHLSKGSLGLAAMTLGFFSPQTFGGYYQPGEKRKSDEPQAAGIRMFGYNLPRWMGHIPLLEVMQIGSTLRRVYDANVHQDGKIGAMSSAATAGALGLAEETPFVQETTEIEKLMDPAQRAGFLGEFTKSRVIPGFVQWGASQTDKTVSAQQGLFRYVMSNAQKRDAKTFVQHLETGVPGLRERVPKKATATGLPN